MFDWRMGKVGFNHFHNLFFHLRKEKKTEETIGCYLQMNLKTLLTKKRKDIE